MGLKEKIRVLVVGDIIVDKYIFGETTKMSYEAPIPVMDYTRSELKLGGAANVALNLKKLDKLCDVDLLGVLGNDSDGSWVKRTLDDEDIGTFFIQTTGDMSNSKTRFISKGKQVLRLDRTPLVLEYNVIDKISLACSNIKWDLIIISDYDYGVLYKESIEAIKLQAKCPIIVDPKMKNFWEYDGVLCIKSNRREITEAITSKIGKSLVDSYDIAASVESLIGEMSKCNSSDYILVTDGENGMRWYDKAERSYESVDAEPCKVIDVTGAGDTVISTLGYCLAKGYSFEESVRYSNKAASKSIEQLGCGYVNFDRDVYEPKNITEWATKYSSEGEEWHQRELERIQAFPA